MKHSKKRLKNIYLFLSLFVFLLANGTYAKAESNTVTKTITFTQSTEQSQSKTITIPNLLDVIGASVDNGDVSYQVNSNEVTIHVSNGTGIKVQTGGEFIPPDSKTVTVTKTVTDKSSLPSEINYDSDGYTGVLTKSGSATLNTVSKDIDEVHDVHVTAPYKCINGSYILTFVTALPSTYDYDSDGFFGVLNVDLSTVNPAPKPPGITCTVNKTTSYDGTAHFKGTVTGDFWTQTYSGTVTKPAVDTRTYETRYAYNVTLVYSVWDINLSSVPINVTFPSITLNGQKQQITTNISNLKVEDDGHTNWYMTVTATQFTDDKGHMLPKNSLEMILPNKVDVLNVEEDQQTTMPLNSSSFFIDGTSNTIFTMKPTTNVVTQYSFNNINLKLNLNPGSTFIDKETGSSTYHSTITWTLVSGP